MANELEGKKIAILATGGVERVELEQPRAAVEDAGATTTLLSLDLGEIAAKKSDLEDTGTFTVDKRAADVSVEDYDGLILPAAPSTRTSCVSTTTP